MGERISRKGFIRLGGALGVSAAAASLAASCGGAGGGDSGNSGDGGGSGRGAGSGGGSGKTQGSGGQVIARASEVAPNSAFRFENSGQPAVLVHLESGRFVAYSAVCTHMGCTVGYQKSSGDLVCPCHGSVFDPSKNARVLQGPAPRPLPGIPIKIEGGKISKA